MYRRELLRRAVQTLLVLPFGTFLVDCGAGDDVVGPATSRNPTVPGDTLPDAPARVDGDRIVYTSSLVDDHSHELAVALAALTAPPRGGIQADTTVTLQHAHRVTITEDELRRVAGGQRVQVETTRAIDHVHVFTLVKIA